VLQAPPARPQTTGSQTKAAHPQPVARSVSPTAPVPKAASHKAQSMRVQVTQTKTPVSAQSFKRPVAPTVYRPQPLPKVLQTKISSTQNRRATPAPHAPPVYRPQAEPVSVQAKMAAAAQLKNRPAAPPVYRPQPIPKVLQTKKTVSQQAGRGMEAEADRMGLRADSRKLPVQAKMANSVQAIITERAASAPSPFPISRVIQRNAAADLLAAEQNRTYLVNETGALSTAGVNVYNAINNAAGGRTQDDAAAGLRYFWQTLIDGFDGKKAEMYEAEMLANAHHIPILSTNDLVDPDVRIVTATGDVHAIEVKTINSDNPGNINRLIKGADAQLGNRTADLRSIKIRIESATNLWPDARYNNIHGIANNTDLKNWLTQSGVIPNLDNANEIQIEGINVPYGGGGQRRNFWAEVKGSGDVKKTGALVW
jgi:hypothetical protein